MVAAGLDGNITAVLSEESNGASSRTSTTSSVNFPSAHFQDIYTVSDNSFHTNSRGIQNLEVGIVKPHLISILI